MSNAASAPSNATALPDGWEMVVGLEVHVELDTATKLFSGSPNRFGDDPNTHIDPVTLGLPGALPVLNRKAASARPARLNAQKSSVRSTKGNRGNIFLRSLA